MGEESPQIVGKGAIVQFVQWYFLSTGNSIQWNLSIMDTLGTAQSVPIRELSLFQRLFRTLLHVVGTVDSVLIREVSLFQRSLIERFHCILRN